MPQLRDVGPIDVDHHVVDCGAAQHVGDQGGIVPGGAAMSDQRATRFIPVSWRQRSPAVSILATRPIPSR